MDIDWLDAAPYVIVGSAAIAVIWACRRIARLLFQNRWSRISSFILLVTISVSMVAISTWQDSLMLSAFIISIACLLTLDRTHHYRWAAIALAALWVAAFRNDSVLIGIMPLLTLIFYLLPRWRFCYFCVAAKVLIILGLIHVSGEPNEWSKQIGIIEFDTALFQTPFVHIPPQTMLVSLSLGGALLIFTSLWFGFKQSHNKLRPTAFAIVASGWLMLFAPFVIVPDASLRHAIWPMTAAIIGALMIKQKPKKALPKAKHGGHKPKSWD